MTFYERLQALMDSQRLTQKDFAEATGIRPTTISEWKKNGNLPTGDAAIKIANYFDISLDYLLTGNLKNELPDEDIALIVRYHNLPKEKQHVIKLLLEVLTFFFLGC